MSKVRSERLTVRRDESFVVFLIGARVNHWWNMPLLWMVSRAMSRMMGELLKDPESGLMSCENYVGRTTLSVQYWRSSEHLLRYAKDKDKQHVPAWRRWIKDWSKGAMGIWHETYVIEPGNHECVYHHMPPFGLGKVGPLVGAEGKLKTARGRFRRPAQRMQLG